MVIPASGVSWGRNSGAVAPWIDQWWQRKQEEKEWRKKEETRKTKKEEERKPEKRTVAYVARDGKTKMRGEGQVSREPPLGGHKIDPNLTPQEICVCVCVCVCVCRGGEGVKSGLLNLAGSRGVTS